MVGPSGAALDLAVRTYANPGTVPRRARISQSAGGERPAKGVRQKDAAAPAGQQRRARASSSRRVRSRVPAPAGPARSLAQQYCLVWSDDFEYSGPPDPAKWSFQTDANAWTTDSAHGEEQWYTRARKKNCWVSNGTLKIRALREQWKVKGADGGEAEAPPRTMAYTSARLVTKGKGDWLYGRVDVCARLPAPRRGAWPAIWMLPSTNKYGTWPRSGEIDIMEAVGHKPGVVHATVHTAPQDPRKRSSQYGHFHEVADAHTRYVVYSLLWTPDEIRISADGHCCMRCKRGPEAGQATGDGAPAWPFDQPFHLVLNVAIGGSWGGAEGVDPEVCPCTLEVAWVRVHQLG